jgi:hypothetical protein
MTTFELLIYCFRYQDTIYVRYKKKSVVLSSLPAGELLRHLILWADNKHIPHRLVNRTSSEDTKEESEDKEN